MRHLVVAAGSYAIPSIKTRKPDTVIYIVSRAAMVGPLSLETIAAQLDLSPSIFRQIELPDSAMTDVKRCFEILLAELQHLRQPEDVYEVDYRAPQPALAAALTLVALHYDNYALVDGATKPMPAEDKHTLALSVHSAPALTADKAAAIDALVRRYHYGPAAEYLRMLLRYPGWKRETVAELNNMLHGFDAWDKFLYADALTRLSATRLRDTYAPMLQRLTGAVKGHGFETVFDLLNNAERMAARGWYDDAAMRIYRAVELFAVCSLRKAHQQDATNLNLGKLPATVQTKYAVHVFDDGTIKIGALECYELLLDVNDAFIGPVYAEAKDKLLPRVLRARNESKLAHGEPPITPEIHASMRAVADAFLTRCSAAIGLKNDFVQFPSSLDIDSYFS